MELTTTVNSLLNTILPGLESSLTKELSIQYLYTIVLVKPEMLRVPVAMAMTKLLLTLPESSLHAYLPG